MEMEMSKCMKKSEDAQTTRKRKRKKFDQFVFLPDDILLEILKRVPDIFLRYKAKYVSKRWFNIITNRILLDHASYILQNMRTYTTSLVDIREEGQRLQMKEQDLDIPHKGMIRSWCNEFLLISTFNRYSLYVYNLINKEGSYLPECNASCGGHYASRCEVALSFDEFKGIYKAVHLFIGRTVECHILILGKRMITSALSKWKNIEVPYKSEGQYIWGQPVSFKGKYLNWIIRRSNDLVSIDIINEEISIISLHEFSDRGNCMCSLFVMGDFLALFDGVSRYVVGIWVLKDFHRATWEKLQSINDSSRDFARCPGKINSYVGIYGIVSKRYIILKSKFGMYSYDLKFGVTKKLDIHTQFTHIQVDGECCVVYSSAPSIR